MKFSFVIPAYNCKNLVSSTVEAFKLVKTTDDFEFEIILIDDGSSDLTGEYFQDIRYPFDFYYYYLERCDISSRSRARNFGITKSCGDYVVFVDADTIVQPNYLLELYRYYSRVPNGVVIGQRLFLDHTISLKKVSDQYFNLPYQIDTCSSGYSEFRHLVFHELSYNMCRLDYPFLFGQTCNIAYPRKDLISVAGFDESMIAWGIEDIELAYRVYKLDTPFFINPKMYVLHQFHGYQEEISVDKNKKDGIIANTDIFYKKHPNALPISCENAYLLFMSLASNFYDVERQAPKNSPVINIKLDDSSDLERVKLEIVKYSSIQDINLVIFDYLENCNLDLWVQRLGKRSSTPFYFPMSLYRFYNKSKRETNHNCNNFAPNLLTNA